MKSSKFSLSTTQIMMLGFALTIIVGALLLCLPAATVSGVSAGFVDALFTAATSVCVTGLTVVTTAVHWSLFGKIVILLLIQIGGLGIVTIATSVMLAMGKKISLKNRILIEDSFNMDTLSGLVLFLRRVLKGVLLVELAGAVCYFFVFIQDFDFVTSLWYSVFHSVSAFCNAGIDILGDSSLMPYASNPLINITTMALIVLGGIGFIVWWDVIRVLNMVRTKEIKPHRFLSNLNLHTKIALTMTVALILTGAVVFFAFEYNNPETMGDMSIPEKIQASFFQSITTRTAGFFTVSQKGLTVESTLFSMLLMFIGGSSVGTAGGVKCSTIAVLILTALATARGQDEVVCFKRRIPTRKIHKALAVVMISILVTAVAMFALMVIEQNGGLDTAFEVVSALGTVGLSRDYTASLGTFGKLLITLCMYIGRIGPITMVIAFNFKNSQSGSKLPDGEVIVG